MQSNDRPVVIVTAGATSPRRIDLYVKGVEEAGATAVVVRPGDVVPPFDGLLLTGGADVNPDLYGQEPDEQLGAVDTMRDAQELLVFSQAREQHAPVFAICRGMQLVNVAMGGTLIQHIEAHEQSPEPELDKPAHGMAVTAGTALEKLVQEHEVEVNSFHHQVVGRLAPGLEVNARDPDGHIEGFETQDGSIIAVQSHPERMLASPWARALFGDLVKRAKAKRSSAATA